MAESVVAALAVGLALGGVIGLLGGGGGVLAVPLLVFVLGVPVKTATTTSLVIVAVGSAAGLMQHHRAGRVEWRTGITFGMLGSIGAVVGSRLSVAVPERVLLAGFGLLLVVAGVSMVRPSRTSGDDASQVPQPWWMVVLIASGVGLVTGFFGVGGGFVVVPALVHALRLPVRRATATSLVVILVNSLVALAARAGAHLDVSLTVQLGVAAAAGSLIGALLSVRVPSAVLRSTFGWLTLGVAAFVAVQAAML